NFNVLCLQDADALDSGEQRVFASGELRQHAAGNRAFTAEIFYIREREASEDVAVGVFHAGDIGEEDEGVGLACGRDGGGHFVGVHVVELAVGTLREASDDGHSVVLP